MNTEKDKILENASKDKSLNQQEADRVRGMLESQIADLNKENDSLRDNYNKSQIREQELTKDVRDLTSSVNERSRL